MAYSSVGITVLTKDSANQHNLQVPPETYKIHKTPPKGLNSSNSQGAKTLTSQAPAILQGVLGM